ncbi:MAG: hypothetical protein Q9181_003027 [Wetmoreana brouardii]
MDPLSIIASVVAVAGLAASTGRAFTDLRSLCKSLPGRLHALSNEVTDFEVVLNQVARVFRERQDDPTLKTHALNILSLLEGAKRKLGELRSIIQALVRICGSSKVPLHRAYAWRKDQPKLQALQDDIKNIKCSLNIMVGASNSQDMMRIRLDLHTITASSSQSAQSQAAFQDVLQTDLVRHQNKIQEILTHLHERVDQRLGTVERLLEVQSVQLEANQSNQLGQLYGPRQYQQPGRLVRKETQHPDLTRSDSLAVRVNRYNSCRPGCSCVCHVEKRSSTPGLVDRVLGQVFVGYTGLPGMSPKCNVDACEKSQSPNMSFEYWFPLGFLWSQIWAMYGKQFQTCKFLVHAGADLDYRPIAASDNSPRNKAHQFLLMGGLPDSDVEALRCLTQDSDFVDEQNYTLLHRIVLGLSMQDLEESLLLHPELIDIPDAMGRTALAWAAARGDERSIVALLQHGAEVNTIDVQHSGVVGHAADRNYVTCVRLLLEAGADPNIAASHGYKVGNPVNVAARNASDPLILKTLLDFGADVDSCGVDGVTGLLHATRKDNISFATLLLEYRANINAVSRAGQTPLTTAVSFNSHNVLQLLLDRWFEYSECPRLKGPHLLQIVALYADVKTMAILTATDHLITNYDADYALGDFACRLSERTDATDKLIQAFEDLLSVINRGPEMCRSPESLVGSGFASPDRWAFSRTDTLGSNQDFVDAVETLRIDTTGGWRGSCPASPTSPRS